MPYILRGYLCGRSCKLPSRSGGGGRGEEISLEYFGRYLFTQQITAHLTDANQCDLFSFECGDSIILMARDERGTQLGSQIEKLSCDVGLL